MKLNNSIIVFIILFFVSCSSNVENRNKSLVVSNVKLKPEWIFKPNLSGNKKSAIGVARQHIRGISEQRKLAISRAIDSIAIQIGVKVSTYQEISAEKNNNNVSSSFSSYSVQTSEGKNFSITLREFWEDNKTGELYVWVTKD